MKSSRFYLILFSLLVFQVNAQTYYVDAGDGNDTNNGTSESTPWKSISKVNSSSVNFAPGTTVRFKRGNVFRGTWLLIQSSGTAADPIVIEDYGDANLPNPILSGDGDLIQISDLMTTYGFVNVGTDLYECPTEKYLYEATGSSTDGYRFIRTEFEETCRETPGTCFYTEVSPGVFKTLIHVTPGALGFRVCVGWFAIKSIKNHITYRNLTVRRAKTAAMALNGNQYNIVQNLHITDTSNDGFIIGGNGVAIDSYHLVEHCLIDEVGYYSVNGGTGSGLLFSDGGQNYYSNHNVVRYCDISSGSLYNFDDHCIYDHCQYNSYYGNYLHDCTGDGIKISNRKRDLAIRDGGHGCRAYNNVVINCGHGGIKMEAVTDCIVRNNFVCVDEGSQGLIYVGNPDPTFPVQNYFVNNTLNGGFYAMHYQNPMNDFTFVEILDSEGNHFFDGGGATDELITCDSNVFKNYNQSHFALYGGNLISNFEDWKIASGQQDTYSLDYGNDLLANANSCDRIPDAGITENDSILICADFGYQTYHWKFNGTPLSETGRCIWMKEIGQYTVTLGDSLLFSTCMSKCTDTINISLLPDASISEKSEVKNTLFYPNPTNGLIVISATFEASFSLTNELGQILQTIHLTADQKFQEQIEILENGVYFIFGQTQGQSICKKIIVAK